MKFPLLSSLFVGAMLFVVACSTPDLTAFDPFSNATTIRAANAILSADSSRVLYIINGGSSSVSLLDLNTNQVIKTLKLKKGSFPHHAYLNPAKDRLAVSMPGMDFSGGHGGDTMAMPGKFALLNALTGELLTIKDTPAMNHNAVFSPNGKELWAGAMLESGKLLIFDSQTLQLRKEIPVGQQPAEVTFSADGQKAFVANGESGSVSVIEVASKQVLKTIPVGEIPVGAWPGADNRMYVDNEHSQTISIINANTLAIEETIALGFTPGMVAFHPLTGKLWVTDADNGSVVLFSKTSETARFARTGTIKTGAGAHAIAFTRDGKTAYVTNQMDHSLSIIDTLNQSKWKDIQVESKPNGLAIREN